MSSDWVDAKIIAVSDCDSSHVAIDIEVKEPICFSNTNIPYDIYYLIPDPIHKDRFIQRTYTALLENNNNRIIHTIIYRHRNFGKAYHWLNDLAMNQHVSIKLGRPSIKAETLNAGSLVFLGDDTSVYAIKKIVEYASRKHNCTVFVETIENIDYSIGFKTSKYFSIQRESEGVLSLIKGKKDLFSGDVAVWAANEVATIVKIRKYLSEKKYFVLNCMDIGVKNSQRIIMLFSKRILKLSESPTLQLNNKINGLLQKGEDVINLTVGEPDYVEPIESSYSAIKAICDHFTHYTNSSGIISLRESICAKLLKENNLAYTPDQIVVSAGGKQALFNAFFVLLNGGEEVLIPTPAWPTYKQQVLLCGGTPVLIPLDESSEFKLTKETLKAFITPRSKILVLNSPSNPTGATYSEEELDDLVSIVEENGLYVISDEIYERLVYSGTYSSPVGINDYMKKHSVLVNGFSKAFGMTGWRIGYTAAPLDISIKIAAFQSQTTASISSISQVAAKYAINNFDKEHLIELKEKRNYLIHQLADTPLKIDVEPGGAFYLFPRVDSVLGNSIYGESIDSVEALCASLLEREHVAITPGSFFDAPNNVRISYAKSMQEICDAAQRIKKYFKDGMK